MGRGSDPSIVKETRIKNESEQDQSPHEATVQARKTSALYQQLAATAEAVPEIYEEALKRLKIERKGDVKDYSLEEARQLLAKCNDLSVS